MPEKREKGEHTTSVRISAELRQKAKVYAARAGTTLLRVVNEAVSDYLKKKSGA